MGGQGPGVICVCLLPALSSPGVTVLLQGSYVVLQGVTVIGGVVTQFPEARGCWCVVTCVSAVTRSWRVYEDSA